MTRPRGRPAGALARTSAARAKAIFYLLLAFALYVGARYWIVQIRDGPKLALRAYEQHVTTDDFAALRGAIYDRDGGVLVRSLPSQSVYVTTSDVTEPKATAAALARALGGEPTAADVLALLQRHDAYVQVEHKISRERAAALAKLALPGVSIVPEETGVRFAPSGRLASTVLGFTGFDENGLDGLESAFDTTLRGEPGRMTLEGDEFGRALPFAQPHVVVAAKPGRSLVLTLDSYLQFATEQVLRETVARWHAQDGSAIVMDPNSGEILALANAPDYDLRDYRHSTADQRRDRAVTDVYEPGSTFKLVTIGTALDSGMVTPDQRFAAVDALSVGGRVIRNADDGMMASALGTESLAQIVAYSHNVGAAEVGLAIGKRVLDRGIRRFGFGEPTDVELPGESPGILLPVADWSASSLPTIAFGQGIATTPLAMARAYCAIANGGLLMRPRIVFATLDSTGAVVSRTHPIVVRRVLTPRTAALLRGYLRDVVTHGTGRGVAEVPGYTTAGKTGTAEIAENGYYQAGAYVASFIGMVPATSPRFVILVKITRPRGSIYGGTVAAPAFAKLAKIVMMHAGIEPARAPIAVAKSVPAAASKPST